ncbi:hypothetical protein [Salinicoccus sp. HZC-1]|uniref:hypothetical protein n=1 Tax=Salinicoccus sp. HZC-1 TaxID=3385497 RepID=UPI00398B5327
MFNIKSPSRELYDQVFKESNDKGFLTVTASGANNIDSYPFVKIHPPEDNTIRESVDQFQGDLSMRLEVFALMSNYGSFELIMFQLKLMLLSYDSLVSYQIECQSCNEEVSEDTTTNDALYHGTIIAEYNVI